MNFKTQHWCDVVGKKGPGVTKHKVPVAQNKRHCIETHLKGNTHSEFKLEQKQTGIQLKTGAVFCLPARSSHSSRIIIPNKRFLETDYRKVEVSPKKPKVEHLTADVEKVSSLPVPSTYRCTLGTRKRLKSESGASDLVCKPDTGEENMQHESTQMKHNTAKQSDVNKEDLKLGSKNSRHETVTAQTADEVLLKDKSVTEHSDSISRTSASILVTVTGGLLQKPNFSLDQTAVSRSILAVAKSLRNQMAAETDSELPDSLMDTSHLASSACTIGNIAVSEVCTMNSSAHSSVTTASLPYNASWNSKTGKLLTAGLWSNYFLSKLITRFIALLMHILFMST